MNNRSVDVRVRLRIAGTPIYGKGVSQLLQLVDQLGSIRSAAIEMNITYRKALAIIKTAEEGFGEQILFKKTGGVDGGGSGLTTFGKSLVYQFKILEEDILNYTLEKTNEYFPFFLTSAESTFEE